MKERAYDYGRSLRGEINNETAQGSYSLVDRDKEIQEVPELRLPKSFARLQCGNMPGRMAEGGMEDEEEDEGRQVEKEEVNAVLLQLTSLTLP